MKNEKKYFSKMRLLDDKKLKGYLRAFYSTINDYTVDEHYLKDNTFIKINYYSIKE